MKVGDLVRVKPFYETLEIIENPGVVLDQWEDDDGYYWYKVHFNNIFEWFEDYKLELVNES